MLPVLQMSQATLEISKQWSVEKLEQMKRVYWANFQRIVNTKKKILGQLGQGDKCNHLHQLFLYVLCQQPVRESALHTTKIQVCEIEGY